MLSKELPDPLSREKLKTLRSLASTKIRKRKGICLVEGERAIEEAARSGNLLYLVASLGKMGGDVRVSVGQRFPDVPLFTVKDDHFSELSDVSTGIGILGAASIPPGGELESICEERHCVLVYLDGLQEPGNVGGIIRTSWAFGVSGVLLKKGTADPFSSKGVRSSAGGIFHIPVFYDIRTEDLRSFQDKGYSIFLAEAGGRDLQDVRFPPRSILALGSEVRGFSKELKRMGRAVGVRQVPGVDSLNVVVAGSIILERMMGER